MRGLITYLQNRLKKALQVPQSGEGHSRRDMGGREVDDTERVLLWRTSRQVLYGQGILQWSRVSQLARLWLVELGSNIGLPDEPPAEAPKEDRRLSKRLLSKFSGGGRHPVRLENGRLMWLNLDTPRQPEGYRIPEVEDQPPVTHQAILAALSVLETADNPVNVTKLRKAWQKIGRPDKPITEYMVSRTRAQAYPAEPEEDRKSHMEWLENFEEGRAELELEDLLMGQERSIEFVRALLRYYRPDFEQLSSEDQLALLERSWGFIKEINDSSAKLMACIEHDSPSMGLPTNSVKDRGKDVRAAVLRRVEGMSETQIGESLGHPPVPSEKHKGGNQRARKMADRGEDFMRAALGEDGWEKQVEAMKAEAEHYRSMREEQREQQREVENVLETVSTRFEDAGISEEQARQRLEQNTSRGESH